MTPAGDAFEHLARYYDPLMEHVDYRRWARAAMAIAALAPQPVRLLDAGCGTGTLAALLREQGWAAAGIDVSRAMLESARRRHAGLPVAQADLRALPFRGAFGMITCLFDSLNFLLEEAELRTALRGCAEALADRGLLYFDVVTERMVTEHFENQEWTEHSGGIHTRWRSTYDRRNAIAESRIRVNRGAETVIRERIYPRDRIEDALRAAGLTVLCVLDGHDWAEPGARSTRLDFIAMKQPPRGMARAIERLIERVQAGA